MVIGGVSLHMFLDIYAGSGKEVYRADQTDERFTFGQMGRFLDGYALSMRAQSGIPGCGKVRVIPALCLEY
jgi:hypothetical protein